MPRGLGRAARRDGGDATADEPIDADSRVADARGEDEPPPPPPTAEPRRALRCASLVPLVMLAVVDRRLAGRTSRVNEVPHYILPGPLPRRRSAGHRLGRRSSGALLVTLQITFLALVLALVGGVGSRSSSSQSRWIELALFPYAVILQVTPIVAIAPLILIYADDTQQALLICAFIVAFFPILSNTIAGAEVAPTTTSSTSSSSTAPAAGRRCCYLKIPAALPYFLAGLRIGGGLALIAAVVAEFAAGSAGAGSGLAFRLLESQYRLNIPRLFAGADPALADRRRDLRRDQPRLAPGCSARWHESAVQREN